MRKNTNLSISTKKLKLSWKRKTERILLTVLLLWACPLGNIRGVGLSKRPLKRSILNPSCAPSGNCFGKFCMLLHPLCLGAIGLCGWQPRVAFHFYAPSCPSITSWTPVCWGHEGAPHTPLARCVLTHLASPSGSPYRLWRRRTGLPAGVRWTVRAKAIIFLCG